MKTLTIFSLFLALGIAEAQEKWQDGSSGVWTITYKYVLKIDTVRFSMILWRDGKGLVHADSAYQVRAGLVQTPDIIASVADNRCKWLFLYDGTLIDQKDLVGSFYKQ